MKDENKSKGKCQLNISIVKLWSDYIFYMRSFIVSSVDKLPDVIFIVKRLEQNQDDIGDLFATVYGEYNGNRFSELLKEHLSLTVDFINSTIKGEIEDSISHKMRCHMDIIKIADFLSAIDDFDRPYLRGLFFEHLHLTEEYLMVRVHGSYENDIKVFDNLHDQILLVANTLFYVMSYRIKD